MKKIWIYTILIMVVVWISGCATEPETPEQTPAETPTETTTTPAEPTVQEPAKPETPATPAVKPVTDEELNSAEAAIAKADNAGAQQYSPDLFLAANEDLEKAKSSRDQDPDGARALIASAIEKANKAYDESINRQIDEKTAKLRGLEQKLYDIKADKYAPKDFQIVKDRADVLKTDLANKDYNKAEEQYNATLRAMQNLYDTVDNNVRWIKILDRDAKASLKDAEDKQVYVWAPDELAKANYNYSTGIAQFNNYDLANSEKSLKEARYWAITAIRLNDQRKRLSQTDQLMNDAMSDLEKASRSRVKDSQGNITEADPWNGQDYINQNPVQSDQSDTFTNDQSSLKDYNPDAPVNPDGESMIVNGTTTVLGDEQSMSLLQQAIELWKQGVKARSEGKFDIADEYFKQSKAYAEAYSANAVANEYIVKKHDTLWGIAGKKDILDNPFLWTKIWRRNSDKIENPDLIYPGQKLLIPPK